MPVRDLLPALGVLVGIACPAALAGLLAVIQPTMAEPPPAVAPGVPRSETLKPVALYDKDGNVVGFNPLPVLTMPFQRVGDPFLLPATTTPQQYAVPQPADTKSYRGVNPCSVDIRIKTAAGMAETVTATSGTRFLARTAETLASSPAMTTPRIVSVMTLGDPGAGGCTFELGYGNGG